MPCLGIQGRKFMLVHKWHHLRRDSQQGLETKNEGMQNLWGMEWTYRTWDLVFWFTRNKIRHVYSYPPGKNLTWKTNLYPFLPIIPGNPFLQCIYKPLEPIIPSSISWHKLPHCDILKATTNYNIFILIMSDDIAGRKSIRFNPVR